MEHEIIRDHVTKRSRGFGFIVFDGEKVVDNLLASGNMIDMAGTAVSFVQWFSVISDINNHIFVIYKTATPCCTFKRFSVEITIDWFLLSVITL